MPLLSRVAPPALSLLLLLLLSNCTPAPIYTDKDNNPHPGRRPSKVDGDLVYKGDILDGFASYYGDKFAGRLTANGETFDPSEMTAAHKTLPFGTVLRVTLIASGKSVVVRINDRGPFVNDRIIDLSKAAAREIGLLDAGVGYVEAEVLEVGAQ